MKSYVREDLLAARRRTLLHLAAKADLLDMPPNEVYMPDLIAYGKRRAETFERQRRELRADWLLGMLAGGLFVGGLALLWMSFR